MGQIRFVLNKTHSGVSVINKKYRFYSKSSEHPLTYSYWGCLVSSLVLVQLSMSGSYWSPASQIKVLTQTAELRCFSSLHQCRNLTLIKERPPSPCWLLCSASQWIFLDFLISGFCVCQIFGSYVVGSGNYLAGCCRFESETENLFQLYLRWYLILSCLLLTAHL